MFKEKGIYAMRGYLSSMPSLAWLYVNNFNLHSGEKHINIAIMIIITN